MNLTIRGSVVAESELHERITDGLIAMIRDGTVPNVFTPLRPCLPLRRRWSKFKPHR